MASKFLKIIFSLFCASAVLAACTKKSQSEPTQADLYLDGQYRASLPQGYLQEMHNNTHNCSDSGRFFRLTFHSASIRVELDDFGYVVSRNGEGDYLQWDFYVPQGHDWRGDWETHFSSNCDKYRIIRGVAFGAWPDSTSLQTEFISNDQNKVEVQIKDESSGLYKLHLEVEQDRWPHLSGKLRFDFSGSLNIMEP